MAGVGEHDVGAVAQQEPVGELLVDDADIAGDEHRAAFQGEFGEALEQGADGAADQGEHDHVVALAAAGRVAHLTQELRPRDLARGGVGHPGLGELAGGGGGTAAQDESGGDRAVGCDSACGEHAPFPPGVGVGEHGDARRSLVA